MISNWKKPFFTFFVFSSFLYFIVSLFNREVQEPFDLLSIPGKDRFFVFIITARNAADHCTKTLSSVLEQSYRNFHIYYIDDGSTDNTYEIAKEFIDKFYPKAPVTLIKNTSPKGAIKNAYERIQYCKNHKVVALLDGDCYFSNRNVLKDFNDLYKAKKVWLAYGQYADAKTKNLGSCRMPPNLSIFNSMRKRYWKNPYFTTFYAGLFQKVKLEDFFFDGKFVGENHESSYMFPMLELAQNNTGYIKQPVCHHIETKKKLSPISRRYKEWICEADPYKPLQKNPGAVTKQVNKNRTADLIIFSYDRPLHLYAVIESIKRYMTGINSISVIYRASNTRFFNAYDNISKFYKDVTFIKQSNWPESDFKSLAIQTIFQTSIEASQYVIFSADDILVNAPIDVSDCIQTLKNTGAYCFALKLGCRTSYCCEKSISARIPHYVQVTDDAIGWQINEDRGDWTQVNCIEMNLYRKVDLHRALFSIDFKHTLDLAENWAEETKPFLRSKRERVGICFDHSKIINIPISDNTYNKHLYSSQKLLELYENGFKLDISKLENRSHLDYIPKFVRRKATSLTELEDKEKSSIF